MDAIEKAYREGYREAIEDVKKMLQRNNGTLEAMLEGIKEEEEGKDD